MKRLDGGFIEDADDAYVITSHPLVHVGGHQQVLGVGERGDGLLRDAHVAAVWEHTQHRDVQQGCFHGDEEDDGDDNEGSKEEKEGFPFYLFFLFHPATEMRHF